MTQKAHNFNAPIFGEEYSDLKNFAGITGFDLDLFELNTSLSSQIQTKIGTIDLFLTKGNVWTVKAKCEEWPNEYGQSSTHDLDNYGLFSAVDSAIRDLIKDVSGIFVNSPA